MLGYKQKSATHSFLLTHSISSNMVLSEIEKDGSKMKIKCEKDLKEALKNAYIFIKFQDFKYLYVSVLVWKKKIWY